MSENKKLKKKLLKLINVKFKNSRNLIKSINEM